MKDHEFDLRSYVQSRVDEKIRINSRLSLRSISKDINISQTTFSDFLRGKVSLSIDNCKKIMSWLDISDDLENYLMLTNNYELSKDVNIRGKILKEISTYKQGMYFVESRRVENFLNTVDVREKMIYLRSSALRCNNFCTRTLFLLKNKKTQEPLNSFYEVFFNHERPFISGGYFIESNDGSFKVYNCRQYNKAPRAMITYTQNKKVKVIFKNGLPQVKELIADVMFHNGQVGLVDFAYKTESLKITGESYLIEDQSNKVPVEEVYKRV